MKARIYKPVKSAMQSGRGNTRQWVLEYETESARIPEPLMGWSSSEDTLHQVRIHFESAEAAISFAKEKGMDYDVVREHGRNIPPKSYLDNFRYTPAEE